MPSTPKKKSSPRIDRRRIRTRSALIGAGQRLFAAKSIDGVTIDDIVDAADVAKGSFYNHFDDMETLAAAIVELVQSDCEREIAAANHNVSDADERMARAMVSLLRYAQAHPDRYRAMVNLTRRRQHIDAAINAGLRHDIEAGLASGQFTDITIKGGMLTAFGLISTAIESLSSANSSEDGPVIAKEMSFMLLRALGSTSRKARSIADRVSRAIFSKQAKPAEQ